MDETLHRPQRRNHRTAAATVVALLVLGWLPGCGAVGSSAQDAAKALATALSAGDVTGVAGPTAQADLAILTRGMDGLRPAVSVSSVSESDGSATVTLHHVWPLATGALTYDSTAALTHSGTAWTPQWSAAVVHPELSSATRLVHLKTWPKRADIVDAAGNPLMTYRPVQRIGINKPDLPAGQWPTSAAALAKKLDIDPKTYQSLDNLAETPLPASGAVDDLQLALTTLQTALARQVLDITAGHSINDLESALRHARLALAGQVPDHHRSMLVLAAAKVRTACHVTAQDHTTQQPHDDQPEMSLEEALAAAQASLAEASRGACAVPGLLVDGQLVAA